MLQIQNKFEIGQKVTFNFRDIEQEGIIVGYDYMEQLASAPRIRYFICRENDYEDVSKGFSRMLYKLPEECIFLENDLRGN